MPATDLPSPPVLRRADQRIVPINVKVLGDSLSFAADLFSDVVPMASPYVLVPAGEQVDVFVADIGHAKIDGNGYVYLDNTLEPPPISDSGRTLLVVSGPAAYHAMGVSFAMAMCEGVEHPSVCVIPEAMSDNDTRTLVALHTLALYKRLHSA